MTKANFCQTREEIQRMRSTQDPIAGLKMKLLDWGVTTEEELKSIDKKARSNVDAEVAEAEAMVEPEATPKVLFEDIYVRGSEPEFLRGRVPEENFYYTEHDMGSEKEPIARSS
jgi:pyruvate dehydrogenase E1 component alpha subunit